MGIRGWKKKIRIKEEKEVKEVKERKEREEKEAKERKEREEKEAKKRLESDERWPIVNNFLNRMMDELPEPRITDEEDRVIVRSIECLSTEPIASQPSLCLGLYIKFREAFEFYLTTTVLPCLTEKHGELMLRELLKRWANNKTMIKWLCRYFDCLSRDFIPRSSLTRLNDVGLICFRDQIFKPIKIKIRDAALSMIYREREGEKIDRTLLKEVLVIFVEIGMGQMHFYENDFESTMLEDTTVFYCRNAPQWFQEYYCPDYMLKTEECLKRERERVSHYLHYSTTQKLLDKAQHELLSVYTVHALQKDHAGCYKLVNNIKVEDLSRIFQLFGTTLYGMGPVADMFNQHVSEELISLVKQAAEDALKNKKDFVKNAIELHDKYMAYAIGCFQNHTDIHEALDNAFVILCNETIFGSSFAKLLATFCSDILKKRENEKLNGEEFEEGLNKAVYLSRYISDKELFAEFCRKELALRLLFVKSANYDHERSMLMKLQCEHGRIRNLKMEQMITDMILSRELQTEFVEYLSNNPQASPDFDFTVTILNSECWPNYKSFDLNLPEEMVRCTKVFKEFYDTKFRKRTLTWKHSLGTCNINGKFGQRNIELIMRAFEALVLLLFNNSDKLSYSEIKSQLNLIDDDRLVESLYSLACGKYKILNKEPNTNTISANDVFEVNSKFSSKMRIIKIPILRVDKKNVIQDVSVSKYAIDASLVRIMKNRQVLSHQDLVSECAIQLKMANSDVKEIKKRIEDLMHRDYLERDKKDWTLYRYLP